MMVGRVLEMLGSRGVSVNEIGPVCLGTESPITPSHPLHAMPPRITRNSYRPRASDRTMVDLERQSACRSLELDGITIICRGTLREWATSQNFSGEVKLQWAGSRDRTLASGRGRTFFLTSLFIELIDHMIQLPRRNPKAQLKDSH